jgi:signal transduction histidine kinase
VWQASAASQRASDRIEQRLQGVARTLSESNFPLTPAVLEQMKGLCGAEFLKDDGRSVIRTTGLDPSTSSSPSQLSATGWQHVRLGQRIHLGQRVYFHSLLKVGGRGRDDAAVLHIYYPEQDYRRDLREAVFPPLLVGAASLLATGVCGWWVALHVSRVVADLGRQVSRIAGGQFMPIPVPSKDDELRDLARDVNEMAVRLQEYESQVRRTEQLRTWGKIGAGLAHEMRNSATGSRMALQIHADECPLGASESLQVATRQLHVMESQLQRFLRFGKPDGNVTSESVNLGKLLRELELIVRPHARHLGIDLAWQIPAETIIIAGDPEGLAQVLLNLCRNAIDAAAETSRGLNGRRSVWLTLVRDNPDNPDKAVVLVGDTGAGPSEKVRDSLFMPFVTDKTDGVGLGLTVANEIVVAHGGTLTWSRVDDTTRFVVQLPRAPTTNGL